MGLSREKMQGVGSRSEPFRHLRFPGYLILGDLSLFSLAHRIYREPLGFGSLKHHYLGM